MISVFVPANHTLKTFDQAEGAPLPQDAVWIDLVNPQVPEDKIVEKLVGIEIPTREEMQEIEISSRLYVERGARYMTATLMCAADSDSPRTTPVTFILAGHRLVTVRYDHPRPFALVEQKLARYCAPGINGEMVMIYLIDSLLFFCAFILDGACEVFESVCRSIF